LPQRDSHAGTLPAATILQKKKRRRKSSGWRNTSSAWIVGSKISRFRKKFSAKSFLASMKAKIIITPKKAVVDPQGITVLKALEHMGHRGIKAVHVGKYLEIELDATDKETARKSLDEAAHKFLSNPVIEDYRLEIE
jgi:phosphoribosylformylglycinamidine synthase PurS subunit